MTQNANPSKEEIARRREIVAHLRARKLTQRDIVEELSRLDPPIETSVMTVNRDLKYLRKQWAEKAARSTSEWLIDEIHDLEEIEAAAWERGKYQIVLSAKERKAKLLGLDKPTSNRSLNIDLNTLSNDQLERLAAGEDLIYVLTTTATS